MILISDSIDADALRGALDTAGHDRVVILTDSNVLPLLDDIIPDGAIPPRMRSVIDFPAGEENKNLDTLADIWQRMIDAGASRKSLMLNVGGGVVTDIGGFAAACFKRGIPFVNVSTTVLGAVDASVGGKTGIDFAGLKNQIGAFAMPLATFIPTGAWKSLPEQEVVAGFAEMLKSGYISSPELTYELFHAARHLSPSTLAPLLPACLKVKKDVVAVDPHEHGLRRILNFGHTAAHAFEALAMRRRRSLPHGIAVGHGLLVALILSHLALRLDSAEIYRFADKILPVFPRFFFSCDDYDDILDAMAADKKNIGDGDIRFVLLEAVGRPVEAVAVSRDDIRAALDIYRDLAGC